jgi:hypothetical protein
VTDAYVARLASGEPLSIAIRARRVHGFDLIDPLSRGSNHERCPYRLPDGASAYAHTQVAKRAIATGENDLRRAAEHIAQAQEKGMSQRLIALAVGKSVGWVNGLLRWRELGYHDTAFGPQSKASRARARVQAVEYSTGKKKSREIREQDGPAVTLEYTQAPPSEAGRTNTEDSSEHIWAKRAGAETSGSDESLRGRKPLNHSDIRKLLVKALGMLGSDHAGERANAALQAEKQRARLGMMWRDLIVPAEECEFWELVPDSDEADA